MPKQQVATGRLSAQPANDFGDDIYLDLAFGIHPISLIFGFCRVEVAAARAIIEFKLLRCDAPREGRNFRRGIPTESVVQETLTVSTANESGREQTSSGVVGVTELSASAGRSHSASVTRTVSRDTSWSRSVHHVEANEVSAHPSWHVSAYHLGKLTGTLFEHERMARILPWDEEVSWRVKAVLKLRGLSIDVRGDGEFEPMRNQGIILKLMTIRSVSQALKLGEVRRTS